MPSSTEIQHSVEALSAEAASLFDRLSSLDAAAAPPVSSAHEESIPYHLSVARARVRSAARHLAAIRTDLRRSGPARA